MWLSIIECIYIKKKFIFKIALKFLILIINGFESIWSFESIVPTPLLKSGHTTLSTQILAAQRNCQPIRIVFVFRIPLQKAADVYANQNGDRPPHSRQTNSLKNILLLQCSVMTPTCYHNPIYDPVGFASGIFDRYNVIA